MAKADGLTGKGVQSNQAAGKSNGNGKLARGCAKAQHYNKKISEALRKVIKTDNKLIQGAIENGELPKCYGHYVTGHDCDCGCKDSCLFMTYDNMAQRSRQRKWDNFLAQELDDGVDWAEEMEGQEYVQDFIAQCDENGNSDRNIAGIAAKDAVASLSADTKKLLQTMVYLAIESPDTAQALAFKLNPNIRSLQDMADVIGITKQALHHRLAKELGIGQRNLRNSLLRLTGKEMEVYKLVVNERKSQREAAKILKISHTMVQKHLKKIKEKGF